MDKGTILKKLQSYVDDGFIDINDMLVAIGNHFSTAELREFFIFLEDEYVESEG